MPPMLEIAMALPFLKMASIEYGQNGQFVHTIYTAIFKAMFTSE
jgi:hypothetical protein